MGSCFSGPLMTFSPILTLILTLWSPTPDANMWHLAAKCSTTHQLTNFVSLSFSAGQAAYMAFIRAFPLKIAACCMWKQSWWALWEWTRLLKLWVIKAKTIRRTKDAKGCWRKLRSGGDKILCGIFTTSCLFHITLNHCLYKNSD